MDRGYLDFERLYRLQQALAFFIIRARKDFRFRLLESSPSTRAPGCAAELVAGARLGFSRILPTLNPIVDGHGQMRTNLFVELLLPLPSLL